MASRAARAMAAAQKRRVGIASLQLALSTNCRKVDRTGISACDQSLKQTAIRACGGVAMRQRRDFAFVSRVTTGDNEPVLAGSKLSGTITQSTPTQRDKRNQWIGDVAIVDVLRANCDVTA
jgi:hypothetical protein